MLRIQFEGLTIELGRDRSAQPTAIFAAAMPYLMSWLHRRGLDAFFRVDDDDKPPPAVDPN